MRLDKFMSEAGLLSRKETAKAVSRGEITVNGLPVKKADVKVDENTDVIAYLGKRVEYHAFVYVMLNKPAGYISATEDGNAPVVTELLDDTLRKRGLFPCGRLDKDTTGLMILTDDGVLSHLLLSPKRHVAKTYAFTLDKPLPMGAEGRFLSGVTLGDELCKPASLSLGEGRDEGVICLTEGKYHQIKRMMLTEGATVVTLSRLTFADIPLDEGLAPGEWRYLNQEEIKILQEAPYRQKEKEVK
ncbi:MAG: rRNA pseudouridine synthase [Clostridia bacterium]|nr:rRNA pseudouridine synthase [Clostridia bacterium]